MYLVFHNAGDFDGIFVPTERITGGVVIVRAVVVIASKAGDKVDGKQERQGKATDSDKFGITHFRPSCFHSGASADRRIRISADTGRSWYCVFIVQRLCNLFNIHFFTFARFVDIFT